MRITPIFNYNAKPNKQNVQFGHISSMAIDSLRNHSEGYNFTYTYHMFDDYYEDPRMVEFYQTVRGQNGVKTMTSAQVEKMEKLTIAASSLKKSIIKSEVLYCEYNNGLKLFVKDKNDELVKVAEVGFKEMDPEYNLSQFEAIVNKAIELEKDEKLQKFVPDEGTRKFARIDKKRDEPRYQNIYNHTIYT